MPLMDEDWFRKQQRDGRYEPHVADINRLVDD